MIFLTQETERQMLPFGKWFLNRKKTKMMKKKLDALGIELATSHSESQRSPLCATYALDQSWGKI